MTDPRQRVRGPGGPGMSAGDRERILARRRLALIVLVALVPLTLVLAIVTGSTMLLIVNLVADVLIAGYVAMLLQIKQGQGSPGRPSRDLEPEDVRVVRR